MQTSSIGGEAETDAIELTVRPKRPMAPSVVTTLTEATAAPIAEMNEVWVMAQLHGERPNGR
jgi:anaerobic C4-dicarboxylate transporter